MTPVELERFCAKVVPEPNSGCWLWSGALTQDGYGHAWVGRHVIAAHRASYAHFKEEIADGMEIDHLCKTRCCVNPAHLEQVTRAENVRRSSCGLHWTSRSHCKNGHPFEGYNTFDRGGTAGRGCRTCRRNATRRYRARGGEQLRAIAAVEAECQRLRRALGERERGVA